MGEPSEKDGSFSVPTEQPTRHFTDTGVRRNYEYILTSTNLYPPELHSAVRSVLSEPPLNPDWSDKGRQIAALFTPYGDREYQGDLLYRTRLHGEDFLAPEVKMYGQALLDIPCYKILMGCDGKNLQETKDLYNLTDAEQELLESKRRGHALFIIGSKRLHVNFEIPAYKFSYMGKAGGR